MIMLLHMLRNVLHSFLCYQLCVEFCGGGALDSIMLELERGLTEPQIRFVGRENGQRIGFPS